MASSELRYAVDPPEVDEVVDPMAWFATPGPFELEIGCGKGGFLLSRARICPDHRFLGIEWANKYFRYAADRMARWGMDHVRVMRTDAKIFVMRHLPPDSVEVMHIYHPDPWPKARHHKRRLLRPDFIAAAVRVLRPGGRLMFQSDHREYFEEAVGFLAEASALSVIEWEESGALPGDDHAGTNFEVKYVREGRSIFRRAYRCVGG